MPENSAPKPRIVTVPKGHQGSAASFKEQITVTPPAAAAQQSPTASPDQRAPKIVWGEEVPSERNQAAFIMRTAPIFAGLATSGVGFLPGLAIDATTNFVSELSARKLERLATDPGFADLMNADDLKAGAIAGSLDAGIQLAQKIIAAPFKLGKALLDDSIGRAIVRKMFMPNDMPEDVAIANNVLSSLHPEPDRKKAWQLWKRKSGDPFGISPGKMNYINKGLIRIIDTAARSSMTGARIMARFDERAIKAVSGEIGKFIQTAARNATDVEFGQLMRGFLDKSADPAVLIKPVEAYKSYLYDLFDNEIGKYADKTIDLSELRNYIMDSGSDAVQQAYLQATKKKLLPPLVGQADVTTKRTRTTTTKNVRADEDVTRTGSEENLLTGDVTEFDKRRIQTRQGEAVSVNETERVTEVLEAPKPTEQEVIDAWKNVSVVNAQPVLREINDIYGRISDDTKHSQLRHALSLVKEKFIPFMNSTTPDAKKYYEAATNFTRDYEILFNHEIIKEVTGALKKSPSGVITYLSPSNAAPGETFDRLMKLKEAFAFSTKTLDEIKSLTPQQSTKMLNDLTQSGVDLSKPFMKEYDESVLQPLRYRDLTSFVDKDGKINARKFLDDLNTQNTRSPEYVKEVWGGDDNVKRIHDLMTTIDVIQKKGESSIFIQLAQASSLIQVAGVGYTAVTAHTAYTNDEPKMLSKIGQGMAILISPYVFAKVLTNPRLTAALNGALYEGVRSTALSTTLRKMASMGYASSLYRDNPESKRLGFFSSFYTPSE